MILENQLEKVLFMEGCKMLNSQDEELSKYFIESLYSSEIFNDFSFIFKLTKYMSDLKSLSDPKELMEKLNSIPEFNDFYKIMSNLIIVYLLKNNNNEEIAKIYSKANSNNELIGISEINKIREKYIA